MLLRALKLGKVNGLYRSVLSTLLTKDFLLEIAERGSLREVASALRETCYAPFITDPSGKSLLQAFKSYFQSLLKKYPHPLLLTFFTGDRIKALKEIAKEKELKRFAVHYSDFLDLLTILKYRVIEELEPEVVVKGVLGLGKVSRYLPKLLKAKSVKEISENFFLIKRVDSYTEFRREIYKYHVSSLRSLLLGNPFTLTVPLVVIRLKEIEMKNLTAIVEGIENNFELKEIKEMIVDIS